MMIFMPLKSQTQQGQDWPLACGQIIEEKAV
jgi:hypothetical protein